MIRFLMTSSAQSTSNSPPITTGKRLGFTYKTQTINSQYKHRTDFGAITLNPPKKKKRSLLPSVRRFLCTSADCCGTGTEPGRAQSRSGRTQWWEEAGLWVWLPTKRKLHSLIYFTRVKFVNNQKSDFYLEKVFNPFWIVAAALSAYSLHFLNLACLTGGLNVLEVNFRILAEIHNWAQEVKQSLKTKGDRGGNSKVRQLAMLSYLNTLWHVIQRDCGRMWDTHLRNSWRIQKAPPRLLFPAARDTWTPPERTAAGSVWC